LTFGEGQRQFDIGAGQNYLGKAVDIAGRDTLRSAAYLLGDTGGMTPIEGALRAFRPVSVTGAGGMSPEAAVKNVAAGPPRQPVPAVPPDSATATYIDPVTGKRTNVRPRAKGTRGAGKGYLVGEGEGGEGLRAGTAEVVQMTPDRRVKAIIPIERAYALGTGDAYEPIPTVPRPPPIQHPIQYPGYPTVPTPGPGYNGGPWPIPAWREAWKEAYNRLPQTMGGGINPVTGLPISTYQKKGTPLVPGTEEEYLRASYERVPEAPYGGPANFNQDQTYWEDILARSEERLKADPNDAAATVARTEAFQKLGEMSTRNLLYRAFYGNVPPAAGSLTQGPVSLAPNAQGEIASAERSGISPLFDTPLASSESQAARFYRLPPDVQQTILSAYGLRNLNAGESLRRMKEVTPVGLRAGSGQFGYG